MPLQMQKDQVQNLNLPLSSASAVFTDGDSEATTAGGSGDMTTTSR